MTEMIRFGSPWWLAAGVLCLVLLILLYRQVLKSRKLELSKFAAPHLLGTLCANVSGSRRNLKKILILLAIGCCFVALARPQYGFKWVEVKRKGIDILFAVDTSKSMLVEDVRPNRLKRAKFAIMDFVGQLEGDRVGLMPFAGTAFLMCPMTIDYGAFESSLKTVDTSIIPLGGTDFAAAIRGAEGILSNEANHKILVMVTDGENLQGDVLAAAKEAAAKGMTIYTVGVGTSEGELIPFSRKGKSGFVKDASGNFVTSQLDESMLSKIAEATGGLYVPLGQSGEGLQSIYQEKLSLIPKKEVAEKRHRVPLERFEWPLAAAIFFLMLEFVVGGRKSSRSLRIPFIKTAGRRKKKVVTALFLLCSLLVSVPGVKASGGDEKSYAAGDYLGASAYYDEQLKKSPNDARLHYNYGTAAYKNNMFKEAAKAFGEALKSDDLELQQEAYYNRGNALFQRGKETLKTDPEHSMDMWQQAVDSYDGALQLDSVNKDARYNQQLVSKKLKELKKQQEKKKKDKKEKKDQQSKKKDKKKDKKQDKKQDKQKQSGDKQSEKPGEGKDSSQNKSGQKSDQQKPSQKSQDKKDKEAQQQQKSTKSDKKKEQKAVSGQEEKQGTPKEAEAAARKDAADAAAAAKEQQAQARDRARRAQGKMTRDEARQLLNSLKDETGDLNFIPSAGQNGAQDQKVGRDW